MQHNWLTNSNKLTDKSDKDTNTKKNNVSADFNKCYPALLTLPQVSSPNKVSVRVNVILSFWITKVMLLLFALTSCLFRGKLIHLIWLMVSF